MTAPGMATQHALQRQPTAPDQTVPRDRLISVIGTRRQMPATRTNQRRQGPFIDLDQEPGQISKRILHLIN